MSELSDEQKKSIMAELKMMLKPPKPVKRPNPKPEKAKARDHAWNNVDGFGWNYNMVDKGQ